MSKPYFKRFRVAILNDEYFVDIILGDIGRAKKLFARNYPDIDTGVFDNARGYFAHDSGQIPMIWVGLSPKDPHFYASLAHEAVHAIESIFCELKENDAPEIYAHCVGAVVAKVERWVKCK